jgi:hypothetical protein
MGYVDPDIKRQRYMSLAEALQSLPMPPALYLGHEKGSLIGSTKCRKPLNNAAPLYVRV